MPAHNEEGYLEPAFKAVVAGLAVRGLDYEVVITQNGSTDATSAEAAGLAGDHPQVSVVDLPEADYGRALREGFLRSRGEVVINFDVDLVDLDFLDRALTVLEGTGSSGPGVSPVQAAVVVGSKRNPRSEDRRSAARRLVTATFAAVLRFGFGLRISDTHGLKALRREPLAGLVAECRFGKDIFDTELIIRAERAGLRVEEIPVNVSDTRPPRTPIARRIPRTLAGLARLWWVLRRSH